MLRELVAVTITMGAILYSQVNFLYQSIFQANQGNPHQRLKVRPGMALLLGKEILVAKDIIRIVALEATL